MPSQVEPRLAQDLSMEDHIRLEKKHGVHRAEKSDQQLQSQRKAHLAPFLLSLSWSYQ
jgi:hypothetical protein